METERKPKNSIASNLMKTENESDIRISKPRNSKNFSRDKYIMKNGKDNVYKPDFEVYKIDKK